MGARLIVSPENRSCIVCWLIFSADSGEDTMLQFIFMHCGSHGHTLSVWSYDQSLDNLHVLDVTLLFQS